MVDVLKQQLHDVNAAVQTLRGEVGQHVFQASQAAQASAQASLAVSTTAREMVSKSGPKAKESLINRKGFINLPSYSGRPEEFQNWHFKLKTFLCEEQGFEEVLRFMDQREDPAVPELHQLALDGKPASPPYDLSWLSNHSCYQK